MDRFVELGQLLDWYGAFLTQRQRSLVRQYAFEDCSLGEIAEREGISRQAVRDAIATAETELRDMEQKLGLIEKNERSRTLLQELLATSLSEHQRELAEQLLELSSGEEEA
ncbi:MAG: sigma factor-like helix-turn-helix DNA-binding protein [Clostridiaceae bacterium]